MTDRTYTVENIFEEVLKLSGGTLNNPDDLKLIIGSALNQNKLETLESLSFHAKFSDGILSVIRKKNTAVPQEYFSKAEEEFKNNLFKVRGCLEEILTNESEFIKSILTEKYLHLSQSGLENLSRLCSDLSYLKLFFNDIKKGRNDLK